MLKGVLGIAVFGLYASPVRKGCTGLLFSHSTGEEAEALVNVAPNHGQQYSGTVTRCPGATRPGPSGT